MSDDEAYAAFRAVRFADNGGEAFCPHCGCHAVYEYAARRIFKCKACERQFSLTSGTLFASRKLAIRDILTALALFVNGANGHAALRMGRDLNVSYKTAFVLLHKLREAMGDMRTPEKLSGVVEVDGIWVGGKIRKRSPSDRRLNFSKPRPKDIKPEVWEKMLATREKQRVIVTLRERREGGRSRSFVCKSEGEAVQDVLAMTREDAVIHVDEGPGWNRLHAYREVEHVNHSRMYVTGNGVHVNNVESFNSRVRRAERGVHHRISGNYLQGYADEFCWREDHNRVANGQQFASVLRTVAQMPVSRTWKGYWQRRRGDTPTGARARMQAPR